MANKTAGFYGCQFSQKNKAGLVLGVKKFSQRYVSKSHFSSENRVL